MTANHRNEREEPSPRTIDPEFDHFFSETVKFLHEPIRLQIMAYLNAAKQVDMKYLQKSLGVTWGNLSFHTSKLEERHWIIILKQFVGKKPYTVLEITPEGKAAFEEYKANMQNLFDSAH